MPMRKLEIEAINTTLKTEEGLEHDFWEEEPEGLIPRLQTFFWDNLSNIITLTVLTSLTVISFFVEAKLISLNIFFPIILVSGYTLGKRFGVLMAFLTILIVWAFIISDEVAFLLHYSKDILNFYMTLWGGFLILTGWLGSALAKSIQGSTKEASQA